MKCRSCVLHSIFLILAAGSVSATSSYPPPVNIPITAHYQLQNEEQAWISPVDSNHIVTNYRDFRLGFRQIGIATSSDAGQSWSLGLIPNAQQYFTPDAWQSDPTLTVDRLGNFYMTALDFLPAGGTASSTISVYVSSNNGTSWSGPVPAVAPFGNRFEDKQFTAVDRTGGVYDGNFYMAWARFPNPNEIIFVRSTDGCQTFESEFVIGPSQTSTGCGGSVFDAGQFANVMVHKTGTVHAFWVGSALDSGTVCNSYSAMKQVTSIDGGASFSNNVPIFPVSGWTSADGGIATYSQPACDADITDGPFGGNMYMAFTNIGAEDVGNSDIDFVRSTDNGVTWSDRLQINDDANSEQIDNFHPWLFVNREGVIIVVFYDQRFDAPTYFDFDLLAAYSFDAGVSFTTNHRITNVSSSPNSLFVSKDGGTDLPWVEPDEPFDVLGNPKASPKAGLLGEYIAVSAYIDKVNAVWTDSRDGNSNVYTANWYLPLLEPRLLAPAMESAVTAGPLVQWATSWKHDMDRYRVEVSSFSDFSSIMSQHIVDTPMVELTDVVSDGVYYWRVKAFTTDLSDSSEYSETWVFELDATPPAPLNLVSPIGGAVLLDSMVSFDWSTALKSLVTYDLFISTDAAFPEGSATTTVEDLVASEYMVVDPLEYENTFYWYVVASDLAGNITVSDTSDFHLQRSCCIGIRGNVDGDPEQVIDLTDVLQAASYAFLGGPEPACLLEANADADAEDIVDLNDILLMAAYAFLSGPPPEPCP